MLPPIIVVMGVSGSGKSTIGKMLAEAMHLPFYDADDYHPAANVQKMQAGIPLDDVDRFSWLTRLHALAEDLLNENGGVIACSALKESYRQILSDGIEPHIKWIFLEGEYDLIESRMQDRHGHYMPVGLLKSQFDALEIPSYAIRVSITNSPAAIVQQIMNAVSDSTDNNRSELGIVGLGVMGRNLALNFADHGVALSLYNRHVDGKEEHVARDLIATHPELSIAKGFDDLQAFVASLETPRRIVLMIEAGKVVDTVLEQLTPLLQSGDIIADCGNSHFHDTQHRQQQLAHSGVHLLGVGVSGGEKGARYGPAIMPGGDAQAYAMLRHAFESIAAKDNNNKPCCTYIGPQGSGHFVKMVHNGIEYAEMQLIAEVYGILRHGYGYSPDRIAELFSGWQAGVHRSFLLEITIQILQKQNRDGRLLDQISDATRSKGTGGWTLQAANDLGIASPVIAAAVHARFLFGGAESRTQTSMHYTAPAKQSMTITETQLADAFYLARIINHHLGFELLRAASNAYGWNLDLREIARIWTNGCIIRSALMEQLHDVLPQPVLMYPTMITRVSAMRETLSGLVIAGAMDSHHIPCHAAALNYLNGLTIHQPTGNLIQAQRDYFGAHGFEKVDDLTGKIYHGDWLMG